MRMGMDVGQTQLRLIAVSMEMNVTESKYLFIPIYSGVLLGT